MKKKKLRARLSLRRETLRKMVPEELMGVAGGGMSCGDETACDCSTSNGCLSAACTGGGPPPHNSLYCTVMQP